MQVKKISYGLKKLTSAIKASHLAYAGLLVGQVVSQSAQAAPEGGVVVGGDGSITAQDLTTIIDQKTDLLAIDWDSFNLTEEELVRFLQPDSSSIVLNRILDQNPSTIRGAIESNGHVILANPRGVLFTETATVNVGAITAAGLDMDSSEFMSGNFSFQGENGSAGVVVNRGVINASSAVLVGKQVTNAASGLISAEIVSLAAADEAVLTFDADGMIGVKITKEVMENQLGVDSAVLNEGAIDGAQVLMEAKVSGDLFSSAVNNKGTVRARGIDTSGGKIRLFGGGAEVVNSGALDASGTYGGEVEIEGDSVEHRGVVSVRGDAGAGGSVRVLGDEVVVSGAIDARGIGGGGEILVGGDYQGKNAEIRNANKTTVAADAVIDASGIGNGDGGKVIVWADGGTHFAGVVRAESGELGGDGGFVETSGKVNLYLGEDSMFVSTLSHGRGETGEWLLDPGWLDIADSCSTNCISTAALEGALSSNNVTITVTDADTASGLAVVDDGDPATDYADGIRVSDNLDWNTTNALTLDSFSDVEIGNGVVITASDADLVVIAGGSFTSEGSVSVNSFSLNVGGNGADSTNSLGSVTATSGTVTGGTGLDVFTLSSADDSVVVDGDLQFTLGANIVFSAVEMLDTGSGTDIVTGADGAGWALKGAGQAESSGITFIGADELFAASAGLTGTAGDDSFVLTAIGDVVVDGLTFKNLSDVNGSTGNDTVDASNFVAGLTLTGTNKEISADTLLFSDIENGVASLLTGSSGADLFSIVADNTVDIAGIRVSGLNTVNADLGSDDVIASGPVTLTGNSGEASTAAIDFSGIDTVTAGSLIGSDNNDTFVITGPNAVTAYDIAFSGISSIDTKLGSDSVTGASGIDWVLTAGIDEAENSGITFTGVETLIADLAGLIGSASDENYTLEDNGDVVVSSLTFQSLTAVDAGGGSDTISLASNTNATLNGTDGEASIRGLDFSNIESVTSATLVGSDAGDRYLVTGADSIVANAIAFAGISSVTAGSGDDTATGLNGEDWSLNGSGGAVNNGITFANVETFVADAAGLVGTASDESYTLEDDGDVVVGGLIFRSLTGVDAAGGSDTIALISLADATLNGTDGEASIRGLDFSNIESVTNGALVASDAGDRYLVTGADSIEANAIAFAGISSVTAGSGDDTATGLNGEDWSLNGSGGAVNNGITFANVETFVADAAGLVGTASDESYTLEDDGDVVVGGLSFQSLTGVDAAGGSDTIALISSAGATLSGTDGEASIRGLDFSHIESVTNGALVASDAGDRYLVTGADSIVANAIAFAGISSVTAGSGDDTATGLNGEDWSLNGSGGAVNNGITFANVETFVADAAGLVGTASDESYTLENDGDVVVGGLIFRSLTGVDAAGGSDTIALISSADATLNGTDGEASIRGLDFSNIESVTNGALVASDAGDRYLVTGADSIEANAIAFAGISSVTAGSGDDTATGLNGEDWSLNGSGGAVNNGITFANVETFVADAAGLVGTASDESYTLEDDGDVVIDGLTFRSLKEVRAGEGVDTVFASTATPSAGETNDKKKVKIGNIDFWDVEKIFADQISLSGDFDNILTIIGDGALTIDDIDYFGITSVDAAEGYDMLDAIGTVALNGETGQVRSAEIDFFNIEAVVNGTMSASDNGDDFVITGVNSIEANGIDFSGITTVTGGAGSDTVIGLDGENWSLNGASNPQNNGIVFLNVEEFYAQNAGLDGTASADLFELQGVGTVSYGGFTFKDVSSVDGGSGDDTLDTSGSGLAVTLTGNDFQLSAGGVDFYNIENAIAAALTGSAGADTFTVTGDNALDAWQIHFSGVSSVAADGDTLEGTAAGDVFTLDAAGAVSVAAMTFSNLSAVDGIGGSDSLDASAYLSGLSLTGNDNQLSAGSLVLSNIFSATVATLAGTAGADIFTLDATNNLLADEVAFSGVSAINAGGGLDLLQVSGDGRNFSVSADNALSFDGIDVTGLEQLENAGSTATATGASGADWSLGAIAGEAENSLVTFSGVQTLVANSAGLSGTAADENYSLEDDGDVVIHGLIFRSLAGVDAGAGADTIALVSTAEAVLSGNDGEATIRGIDFSSIEAVSNGTVKGSELDDRFEITGLNQVKANSIDFSAISSIDARGGQDSVTGDGSDWTLDDIIPELNSSGIEFTGVEQVAAAGAGLFGADSAETYALMGGGVVEVSGVTFGGLTFVNAGAGADELNAQAFTGDLALNGNNNELDADGLLFRSIDSVTADTLLGSSGNDNFAVAADGSVSVAGMLFASGIDSIDALDGTDHVEAAADVKLQGNSGKATISNINFTNIESASGTGVGVIATDGDDDFEILADGKIFTGGITIDGVTSIDALGGVDTVIGASGFDWLLLGSKQAENNGIAFGNVEELIAVNAGLQGTAGVDAFTLLSSGDVFVWDMTVSGMQWVHAGTGADSVNASDYSGGLALNGTDNEVSAGDLLFTGIESAVTATLTGSAGTDIFTVSGSGALSAALIDFSGIATLNGAATDAVESTVNDDWTIMADSSQVAHAGITFSGIEAFSGGGGTLRGNDSGADFSIDGSRAVSVGSLRFNDLDDVIAGAGDDTLAAMDSVTLLGAGGAFSSSDMTFSGFESVITADLIGSSGDDTFLMLANSSLSVYGLVISGVDTLDAGSGNDSVLGRSGRGYLLNIDNSVTHDGLVFHNVENFSGDSASLTTTSAAESLTMTADDALDIDSVGLSFSGLVAVDTGAGNDELAARGAVALHGTNTVTAGSIKFTNVDTVTNTGTLSGTAGSDQFAIAANNQLDSYGIRFEDVLAVAAAGGSDALTGLDSEAWQLSGANNTLSHAGIEFTSLETTSGGNGILNGSASADQFILTANNQVTANSITFTAITQVDAGAGVDTISSPDGETWALGNGTGSAAAAGIDFASIESVSGHASHVDAVTNNAEDNFVLSDKGSSLSARGIAFSSVASVVAGADSGDSISSNATDWQLTGTDGELIVNGVNLFGIDQVITADALLRGTANNETFALASDGELGIAGMAFDGIARVEAGGGNDVLQGTVAADNFELTSFGDISVAAIQFSGLERVAAGEGADTVSSSGASWTSVRSGDALVDGSAEATVDSITVLFEGLAGVSGTGAYTGQGIDGEYLFSSLDTMTIGGITFANLSSLTAGSGNDVLRGADIDGVWSVNAAGGNISTGGSSLSFSGVEAIVAGGGADQFTLSGGEFTSIHTGAGSDTVILAGTRLDSLSLGAGNDSLQVSADSSQDVTLSGGVGDDEFQFNIAGKTWQVTDADNRVGNFLFTGFEWLDNNSDGIKLETDRGFNFVNGGDSSASFNRNGAGILFADGMRLGYDGSGDIAITSTSSDTIGGDLQAGRADLIVAGNVDITSNVEVLNIQTAGADIDISVLAQDDLVIDEVNAGGGTITLNSAKFGSLTAETYGDTHLTAGKVTLGSELQQWSVIGSAINPLRMDVLKSVDIVSISYFEPDFIGQVPTLTARGDELESVAGAQAAQGLKSAVQNAVEDFAQVDPGIFSAVNPYSTGVDAVNSPEMQLTGDELLPLSVSGAPDQEDELPRRSAELEGSDDESPQEQPSQQGNRAPLAPEEVGG